MDIEFLLLQIDDKDDNPKDAQLALGALYEEFRKFVYNITVKNIDYVRQREEIATTVVCDVFNYVWNNPTKWSYNQKMHKTQIDGFKVYLAVVARLKRLEQLRGFAEVRKNEKLKVDDVNNDWLWKLEEEEYEELETQMLIKNNLVDECLMEFKERDRDIIRMFFSYYEEGKNMPDSIIKLMESQFETTWLNIRQIISRAKKKIKGQIELKIK